MGIERTEIMHFIAKDANGNEYKLRAETPCDGEIRKTSTIKMTGGEVGYVGRGKYTVFMNAEEIEVTSNDPRAP